MPNNLESKVGCYVLPGLAADPRSALAEATAAAEYGFSTVWIAEKYGTKDFPSLAGSIAANTSDLGIGAAVTHLGFRHPLAIASLGHTLQALSGGRLQLGFGRSAPAKWTSAGVRVPTLAEFEDTAAILRRLWAGERVSYHGPAGDFPSLKISTLDDVHPPQILMAAIGPKTLEMAARHFDGVILHPFLTLDAIESSVARVRAARAEVGLDPDTFRTVAVVMVAPSADEPTQFASLNDRLTRYFAAEAVRRPLMTINGWTTSDDLSTVVVNGEGRSKQAFPPEWIQSSTALGSGEERRIRIGQYLRAGVDEIILHGCSVFELSDVMSQSSAS
jgi:5,10-methylenetetrahydromethanopterin reductase